MSQLRDMLQIYGLFIASIITLLGAVFIGVGLSSGNAAIALTGIIAGGVMCFIGLIIIWSALRKPRPRRYAQYAYYPQYPGYQQYYSYQQYHRYPPYYQQQPYQGGQPYQQQHRPYPPPAPQAYPRTYPAEGYPPQYPPHRPYPPPGYGYRQPTQPPPPPDRDQKPYERERTEPGPYEKGPESPPDTESHGPEELPPPPDYSQITKDPDYHHEMPSKPDGETHYPGIKEQPSREPPPPPTHKIQQPMSVSQPAYGQQQYPNVYTGPQPGYPYYYPAYPYQPGYGAPQGEAKLELPDMTTLLIIFIGAIIVGALGLYTGSILILFFPFAFIIAFSFPSFMWISYVYKKDVHEPEPRRVVLIALTFGFLSTILAIALSAPLSLVLPGMVMGAVVIAPVVEEFSKAMGLPLVKAEIDSELDGVIYGVTIGMGFAMVENFLYELGFIFTDPALWTFGSLLRGLGSTIGHGLGAGFIGYAYASYHLNRERPGGINRIVMAYIVAVGLHALWNGTAVLLGENAMGFVVIVLIAVAEVVILKTLVEIARNKDIKRMTKQPVQGSESA